MPGKISGTCMLVIGCYGMVAGEKDDRPAPGSTNIAVTSEDRAGSRQSLHGIYAGGLNLSDTRGAHGTARCKILLLHSMVAARYLDS